MTDNEFGYILESVDDLSPDQLRQIIRELEARMAATQQLAAAPATSEAEATTRKPVWERILERTAAIPDEEWDKLPPT